MAKFERYSGGKVDLLRGGLDLGDRERGFQNTTEVSGLHTGFIYRGRNTERARGLGKKWKSDFTHIELKVLARQLKRIYQVGS